MKKLLLLLLFYAIPVKSQPVVPNFTTGTLSSTTNTTDVNGSVNGQSYTWTGLDLSNGNKPVFSLTNPNSGNAFQFTETYRAPGGVSNVTVIQRNIESQSVVTSTSVFSQ